MNDATNLESFYQEELNEKFLATQKDCRHPEFHPCVICAATIFKRLIQDVYENCCFSVEKNIRDKGKISSSIKFFC